jgi:hypothetical protein
MVTTEPDRTRVIDWLLGGDPAIRWQVMRDLIGAPEPEWRAEQEKVAVEGWGARLLSHQDPDGRWTPRLYGKKWISTTYSMVLLRRMGLPSSDQRAVRSCRLFLEEGMGSDGGIDISVTLHRSDVCVTGMVVALLYWFEVDDPRRDDLVGWLLAKQMADGGWNCSEPSTHASFHTTCTVLEALQEAIGARAARQVEVEVAAAQGREFFLRHHMFRAHRSGEIIDPRYLRFSFPPRWHYDVLRGLDYLQAAGAIVDDRLEEAVGEVVRKRRGDGTWALQQRWPGETWFEMESVGEPSRWNTLRAMRVLEGWEARE